VALGIDDFVGGISDFADGCDPTLHYPDVAAIAREAGSINDCAVTDN
jgi:hypothetical protein